MTRWRWRRHVPERRTRLADDVLVLAGFADALVAEARRLGAEVPEGVGTCTKVWRSWGRRLGEWADRT
jgi:hypothetical protein